MRFLVPVVEQLDRAATELKTSSPVSNRLALILIDNAAELVLHRKASLYARKAAAQRHWRLPEYSEQELRDAAGRRFDKKLKFLQRTGDISFDERQFMSIAHTYRNKLFHVGLDDDAIIGPIAGTYFDLSCNLFSRLHVGWISWGSKNENSEISRKYLTTPDGHIEVDLEKTTAQLLATKPATADLPTALCGAGISQIEQIANNFQFLVDDNPGEMDAKELLRYIQLHHDYLLVSQPNPPSLDREFNDAEFHAARRRRTEFEKNWRPKFQQLPTESWRSKALELAAIQNPYVALQMYERLRKSMSYIESVVLDAAMELDAYINDLIDQARGK